LLDMIPIHRNTFAVGTVAFWRSAAPSYGVRSWRSAMDRFAVQHGKAIAMLANDGAAIVERGPMRRNGTFQLIRHEFSPSDVFWHEGNCGDIYARIAERERALA
jgi:hypothetical protein